MPAPGGKSAREVARRRLGLGDEERAPFTTAPAAKSPSWELDPTAVDHSQIEGVASGQPGLRPDAVAVVARHLQSSCVRWHLEWHVNVGFLLRPVEMAFKHPGL